MNDLELWATGQLGKRGSWAERLWENFPPGTTYAQAFARLDRQSQINPGTAFHIKEVLTEERPIMRDDSEDGSETYIVGHETITTRQIVDRAKTNVKEAPLGALPAENIAPLPPRKPEYSLFDQQMDELGIERRTEPEPSPEMIEDMALPQVQFGRDAEEEPGPVPPPPWMTEEGREAFVSHPDVQAFLENDVVIIPPPDDPAWDIDIPDTMRAAMGRTGNAEHAEHLREIVDTADAYNPGDTFDAAAGRAGRDEGTAATATANPEEMDLIKSVILSCAGAKEMFTADDVYRILIERFAVEVNGKRVGAAFLALSRCKPPRIVKLNGVPPAHSKRTTNNARPLAFWSKA